MNYTGVAALILGAVVFILVQARLRKQPAPGRCCWLLVLASLSIPSIWFATYYLHLQPESLWLYRLRALRGSEFLVVFLGAAGGALASLLPRLLIGLPLFGYLLIGAIPYVKPLLNPLADSELKERWQDDVCLQSTGSTCGPACVATLLRQILGLRTTEREVARACFTTSGGTEAWYLARFVRSAPSPHGMYADFTTFDPASPEFGNPAVIGVRIGGAGHFIALLEKEGDQITFADPMHGKEQLPLTEFLKRYHFTGFQMLVIKD